MLQALCERNPPMTGGFPTQKTSNAGKTARLCKQRACNAGRVSMSCHLHGHLKHQSDENETKYQQKKCNIKPPCVMNINNELRNKLDIQYVSKEHSKTDHAYQCSWPNPYPWCMNTVLLYFIYDISMQSVYDGFIFILQGCFTGAGTITGLILGLHPANERLCHKVTPSLIGWAQT